MATTRAAENRHSFELKEREQEMASGLRVVDVVEAHVTAFKREWTCS